MNLEWPLVWRADHKQALAEQVDTANKAKEEKETAERRAEDAQMRIAALEAEVLALRKDKLDLQAANERRFHEMTWAPAWLAELPFETRRQDGFTKNTMACVGRIRGKSGLQPPTALVLPPPV